MFYVSATSWSCMSYMISKTNWEKKQLMAEILGYQEPRFCSTYLNDYLTMKKLPHDTSGLVIG